MSQEPQNRRGRQDRDWPGLLLPTALILGLVLLLSLNVNVSGVADEPAEVNPLEGPLKLVIGYFAAGAEIAAAVVIGIGILRGVVGYARLLFAASATESIRLRLGRVLILGLFTVTSDILRTAVAPTRQDILNLGAIVLLRTLLNYFLEQEIAQAEAKRAA